MKTIIIWGSWTVLLPAIFGIYRLVKRTGNYEQKWLAIFVLVAAIIEVSNNILIVNFKIPNTLPIVHFYTILEFALIVSIYIKSLKKYIPKNVLIGLIAVFSTFSIFNSIFHENIYQFNTYARALEALLIILLVLFYFGATMISMTERHLEGSPIFWISSGLLLYYSASLFIFIYSNIIFGKTDSSFTLWGLHAIVSIIRYLFFTIALAIWIKPKT